MMRRITFKQFMSLKSGDLVLWKGYRLRTVQEGPGDGEGKSASVTFSILRRSWTGRVQTAYGWNDVKNYLGFTGKRVRGLALKSEISALESNGFDIRKGLKRELNDARGYSHRSGKPLCKSFRRLERLTAT